MNYVQKAFIFVAFFLLPSLAVSAQEYASHADCGYGKIRDNGSCQSVENVLSRTGDLFWVDQKAGSDSNPGTKASPWKTISRSVESGKLGPGDAVIIREGVYRDHIRPTIGGTASKPITWAAFPGETVVVTGADVANKPGYSGWKKQADGSWRHYWKWDKQPVPDTRAADYRRELFVDNGKMMAPVGGSTRPSLSNGQFWVEGSPSSPNAVYLKTFNGGSPNDHTIEVGQRNQLFASAGESSAQCGQYNQGYYRLIGLHFRHATSQRQQMAVCTGKQGSRFEEITANWNNGGGIKAAGAGHIIRGVDASYNGIEGIGGTGCDGCVVEYSTVTNNNWMTILPSTHGGGGKWTRTVNSVFRYNQYLNNEGSGLWLDINNLNNEIYGNRFDRNHKQGLMLEHGSSNNRIYNNVITRTRFYSDVWNGIGISLSVSDGNFVAYNTVMLNDGAALRIAGDNRGDATHSAVFNNLFLNNLQGGEGSSSNLREVVVLGNGPNNGMSGWDRVRTHRFNGNAYDNLPGTPSGSGWRAEFMLAPGCNGCKTLYTNDVNKWRSAYGFDQTGMLIDKSLTGVTSLTDHEQGWLLPSGSQFSGRAIGLPGEFEAITTDYFGNARPVSGGSVGAHEAGTVANIDVPTGTAVIGEAGQVTVSQNGPGQWHTVQLKTSYIDPVVVMGPVSFNGSQEAMVRVRSVSSSQFQFQIDEWDYMDGAHYTETISYVVMESGSHVLADGTRAEARNFDDVNHNWKTASFATPFVADPVVLAQVVTTKGPAAVVPRLKNVDNKGFDVFVQEEEAADGNHYVETVAYIAFGPSLLPGKLAAGRFSSRISSAWSTARTHQDFSGQAAFVAMIQTFDGSDTANLRYRNASFPDVDLMVHEEQSADDEMGHIGEIVGYVAVEPGFIEGEGVPLLSIAASKQFETGMTTTAFEDEEAELPAAFDLEQNYPNPFNPSTTIGFTLPETAMVRLEVFDMTGRSVAILANGTTSAGHHSVTFDAGELAGGVYMYRLQAGDISRTATMVLLK